MTPMFNILGSLASGRLLADVGGTFLEPPSASTIAPDVDWLFYFILAICIVFFLIIVFVTLLFAWKYRYVPGVDHGIAPGHSNALELTWTFIPTVLVVLIFYYGFTGYVHMSVPPANAYEIGVQAQTWNYSFQYPNGVVVGPLDLTIPSGQPVVFVLNSSDVIHGFYVPAFRIKKDIVPGRYNKCWATAVDTGKDETYDVFCTQYCGKGHSTMRAKLTVKSPAAFKVWMEAAANPNLPPKEMGQHIWQTRGCISCHSNDGTTTGVAPSWKDVYLHEQHGKDGTTRIADEDYLHLVITQPNVYPLQGFTGIMPPTQGLLNETQVQDVILYVKSLSDKYKPEGTTKPTTAASTAAATQPATATQPAGQ
jgi:cytochrome c oxidase subunit 2